MTCAFVKPDSYLTLHYRLQLASQAADAEPDSLPNAPTTISPTLSTFESQPATLQLGQGQLSPHLEAYLIGLPEGTHHEFHLPANEAFGARNPELIQKIKRDLYNREIDPSGQYQPGELVHLPGPTGGTFQGVLKALNDDYALFDFNHPLAGKAVKFEVHIIGIL